jgi:hypothetical protein
VKTRERWKRRGSSWEGVLQYKRRRKSEEDENSDKRIVMMKLITQE